MVEAVEVQYRNTSTNAYTFLHFNLPSCQTLLLVFTCYKVELFCMKYACRSKIRVLRHSKEFPPTN